METLSPTAEALSFVHPTVVAAGLALAGLALSTGLRIRSNRRRGRRRPKEDWRAHVRWSQPAAVVILIGATLGPGSAVWLRGWEPLATFHGRVGLTAATAFAVVAWLGLRVRRGEARRTALHGGLALLAVALGALAAITGIELLP